MSGATTVKSGTVAARAGSTPSDERGAVSVRGAAAERAKILIVDDVPENLVALGALLARDDVELVRASSGTEALGLLLDHEIAVALVDVQMPEMDGFELAELMRGTERTKHIPIIFVTAGARDQSRVFAGYEAGAVDFLFKPVEPHILLSKVDVFITLHRQRVELQRQVDALQRALETNQMFVGILGHDLRAPLAVVELTAEMWSRRQDEASKRAAGRLQDASRRMSRMIRDLLDAARARGVGQMPVVRHDCDLAGVARSALSELEATARGRPLLLESKGDTRGSFDADRITQVITNLVANALEHGAQGTPVQLALDGTAPREVTLSVTNEGALTVKASDLFDPFVTGRPQSGFGLGLYIVRLIVEAHHGTVSASSVGKHTVFHVALPRGGALS